MITSLDNRGQNEGHAPRKVVPPFQTHHLEEGWYPIITLRQRDFSHL